MLDPNRNYYTFGEIAEHWSLEPGHAYSEEQILDQLLSGFWLDQFSPEGLGWNERKAALELSDESYDPELRPGRLLPDVANRHGRPSDFRLMTPGSAFSFLTFVEDPLWPSLSDTFGKPKFPQLAEAKFSRFSDKGQIVLENIAVIKEELRRWCETRQIKPPRFAGTEDDERSEERTHEKESSVGHANLAQIRGELRPWLEKMTRAPEAQGWTKADFLKRARGEIYKSISPNLFNETWREADIPDDFRRAGRRS